MKQLSWERSGTPERTAAVPTLCWHPLCPQPCSPFLWPPQSRPFQTRNVQSSHGPSRSGARQERRGKRQGTQSPTPTTGARRTLPAGGAGQRTRPYLSFPPGPHLRRRARPVATAARFPWSPRVASLPRRGCLRLSGINPRQTESHGLRGDCVGSDATWNSGARPGELSSAWEAVASGTHSRRPGPLGASAL